MPKLPLCGNHASQPWTRIPNSTGTVEIVIEVSVPTPSRNSVEKSNEVCVSRSDHTEIQDGAVSAPRVRGVGGWHLRVVRQRVTLPRFTAT